MIVADDERKSIQEEEKRKTLGVIGGLGPLATACYLERMIRMTDAARDQDHVEMIVYNCPRVPDRTAYILGRSEQNPVHEMIRIGQRLVEQGADYIGIPCVTAHYFHEELQESIAAPILHAIRETGLELQKSGVNRVGILATDGTVTSGLFQKEFAEMGIATVLPDAKHQRYVTEVIYDNVKAGLPVDAEKFFAVSESLKREGAQVNILGCTELSLAKEELSLGGEFLDTLDVLAQRSVLCCGGKVKEEYQNLLGGSAPGRSA